MFFPPRCQTCCSCCSCLARGFLSFISQCPGGQLWFSRGHGVGRCGQEGPPLSSSIKYYSPGPRAPLAAALAPTNAAASRIRSDQRHSSTLQAVHPLRAHLMVDTSDRCSGFNLWGCLLCCTGCFLIYLTVEPAFEGFAKQHCPVTFSCCVWNYFIIFVLYRSRHVKK